MDMMQSITESEMEIMRIIWSNQGSILLSPLMEALAVKGKDWKANTVLTFLSRLCDKGILNVKKQGRLNEYVTLIDEEGYTELLTRSFLGKVYGGNAKGLVASLLKQDCLSPKDIEELQAFWNGGDSK